MSIVRCPNGHFYDNAKFRVCPHCGTNTGRSAWTQRKVETESLFEKLDRKKSKSENSGFDFNSKEVSTRDLDEQIKDAYKQATSEPEKVVQIKEEDNIRLEELSEKKKAEITDAEEPEAEDTSGQELGVEEILEVEPITEENLEPEAEEILETKPVTEEIPKLAEDSGKENLTEIAGKIELPKMSMPGRLIAGWLVCTKGYLKGCSFNLYPGENTIGRSQEMDICLMEDLYVSRNKQAVIYYDDEENVFYARPGDSREKYNLNNEMVLRQRELSDGDVINVGSSYFIFKAFCGREFTWNQR